MKYAYLSFALVWVFWIAALLYAMIERKMHGLPATCASVLMGIWFAVAVFMVPGQFAGWSKPIASVNQLPEYCLIKSFHIQEGKSISFWVIELEDVEEPAPYLPQSVLHFDQQGELRCYSVPYTVELHQQLAEAMAQMKKIKNTGFLVYDRRGLETRPARPDQQMTDRLQPAAGNFRVLNPATELEKQDGQ